jgi:hypothetical protein
LIQEICLTKKANIAENMLKHAQNSVGVIEALCLSEILLAILANTSK